MRNFPRLMVVLTALAIMAVSIGASSAVAQTSVATTEAQSFLGVWSIALDAQGQTFTMDVDIKDASGNLAAEISSDMAGTAQVEEISKTGENLVLSYSMDAQGQEVPVVMTLAPDGAGLNAHMDFADGMFEIDGKGTKK